MLYKFHQNVANPLENERFQLQNVAKTVEMAASSSKMLQIARKTARKTDFLKKNRKQIIPKTIPDPFIYG
jgi:hypothetical protein